MTDAEIARLKNLASQLLRGYANYPQDIPIVTVLGAVPRLIEALEEARRDSGDFDSKGRRLSRQAWDNLLTAKEQAEAAAAAMREALEHAKPLLVLDRRRSHILSEIEAVFSSDAGRAYAKRVKGLEAVYEAGKTLWAVVGDKKLPSWRIFRARLDALKPEPAGEGHDDPQG